MANSTNPDLPKSPVVPLAHTESGSNIGAVPPLPPPVSEPEATLQASTMFAVSTIAEAEKCAQTDIRACALLDLPVDVLRLIVKEVKQANDLITLALTCSTLHSLAIPHIYARFDIVWPESASTPSSSKNVDALTYGLSTLCLGSKFGQRARWLCGGAMAGVGTPGRLVDNQYAKFTRKFGLGNGPHIWVSDYNVTKESGKMLGTLVSLAVAKMVNLETFVWDMPTGVLSDVFMALASLQDDPPGGHCKLEKVHIRWHESWQGPHGTASSESSPVIQPANPVSAPQVYTIQPTSPASHMLTRLSPPKYAESHVEYPTFSVLPPLKSLTVLDINELAYLDEISVLIERSKDTLQELRLGIHHKAIGQDFASAWEGDGLQQVDLNARWPGESAIGDKRLGGVLGVVVGRIFEIRQKRHSRSKQYNSGSITPITDDGITSGISQSSQAWASGDGTGHHGLSPQDSTALGAVPHLLAQDGPAGYTNPEFGSKVKKSGKDDRSRRKRLDGKLRLQSLELERITLSINVCCKVFDWSYLTSLTILSCNRSDALWKALRKRFEPTPPPHGSPAPLLVKYHLTVKELHCDATTPALLNFIRETLEPNTLEVLFLQDRRRSVPAVVGIDVVFKVVKRHHLSLKKLLLDSNEKIGREPYSPGNHWRRWVLNSDMVSYLTSGRMNNLRELAVALHYRDWHLFLQRLPNVLQLRSVHVLQIQDHIGGAFEPKELALQLVDIVTLRPEVQLCYVGIRDRCFEILECSPTRGGADRFGSNGSVFHQTGGAISVIDLDDEDNGDGSNNDSDTDETEDEDDDDDDTNVSHPTEIEDDFTEVSDVESGADNFDEPDDSQSEPRLRLKKILFCDDKVAVFKARHGRI